MKFVGIYVVTHHTVADREQQSGSLRIATFPLCTPVSGSLKTSAPNIAYQPTSPVLKLIEMYIT